ncbi:MAG: transposase, partial [Proteobacteria bacterium]
MTHKRYADYVNGKRGWTGHLWQQRFYSCPVDELFFWVTIKYIERNPVEAKLVDHAADYKWSSAAYHCGLRTDSLITRDEKFLGMLNSCRNWHEWLATPEAPDRLAFTFTS